MIALSETLPGWPLAASLAATTVGHALREGRRRSALNRALHEVRRPVQALALAAGPGPVSVGRADDPVELAAAALDHLDREINGDRDAPLWSAVDCRALLRSAVGRWQARARIAECSLELRWNAGFATVSGDRFALAQALDNLIVNAIDHGGSSIVVAARLRGGLLRIAIADSGRITRSRSRRGSPAEVIARLSGRSRRGHGLAVVRRVASAHGGRFAMRRSERGSVAALELPLADGGGELAA